MGKPRIGHSAEWRNRGLNTDVVRLGFKSPDDAHKVEDPERVDGVLHQQWVRRDLLGMPKRWENDGLTLVIPKEALDRVTEELTAAGIDFTVI